jgi:hypothetical protein
LTQTPQLRRAALTSAGVVLVAAGAFLQSGWPLLLGGLACLVLAVSSR